VLNIVRKKNKKSPKKILKKKKKSICISIIFYVICAFNFFNCCFFATNLAGKGTDIKIRQEV
jgi:preprotein translocase subunit SecA